MYTWNVSWFCDCTRIEGPCGGGGNVPRGFLLCVPRGCAAIVQTSRRAEKRRLIFGL